MNIPADIFWGYFLLPSKMSKSEVKNILYHYRHLENWFSGKL